MPATPGTLRRTPLYDRHVAAGARLVEFAGWEMPVQYEGVSPEHVAVREHAGMFDVSHMGQIETTGAGALALMQLLTSNDAAGLADGGAQYSVLCRQDGGVLDDVISYRLGPERFLTVTNAANHERDLAWFAEHADGRDLRLRDRIEDFAMLAVQGPAARAIVAELVEGDLPARMTAAELTLLGRPALVCGTGYTGEDGVELLIAPDAAAAVWDALVQRGVRPAGLAARDTLRTEACLPLYGNDLSEQRGPIEAGLGWCCKEETGFVGAAAVRAVRERGPAEKLVPFKLTDSGVPRPGCPVVGGGLVASGTFSPSLRVGVGLAYLPSARAEPGTAFAIDVRGRERGAVVATKPLYVSGCG